MSDNGSACRSRLFRTAMVDAGCRHIRTRPYTPKANGKAERFIQSSLREWAYAKPFSNSAERSIAMRSWIGCYNHSRPHSAFGRPPISRIARDNLLGSDS